MKLRASHFLLGVAAAAVAVVLGLQSVVLRNMRAAVRDRAETLRFERRQAQARSALLAQRVEAEKAVAEADREAEDARLERERTLASGSDQNKTGFATRTRFDAGTKLPVSECNNVGRATPYATLETALWAAAGGDVDVFASTLVLDDPSRKLAQALFDSLPPDQRARYLTPEKLVAALTIPDVPAGEVDVRYWDAVADPQTNVRAATIVLSAPEGPKKAVSLSFYRLNDEWKLIVSPPVIRKYAARLSGKPAAE